MSDKDRIKKLSMMTNEEIEKEAKELMNDGIPKELIKPLWEDEMLKEQIANTTDEDIEKFCEMLGITRKPEPFAVIINDHIKNSVERKRQLMRLEKEMLVDMVFDLEGRNEFLLHNLSEVEKMYNKLKEEKENE